MKYTAEELYTWCVENDMLKQVAAAQYYNKQGFTARPLQGRLVKKENQYYYEASLANGYEISEAIGKGSDKENAVLDKVSEHPEVMMVSVVEYQKKLHLKMVFAETEEERIQEMEHKILVEMFETLEIDTQGKLKKLMEEVKEMQASRQAWKSIGQRLKKMKEEKH